jgi:hypothetical protein
MDSLKIFTPFGLIFLPAVTGIQEFTNVLQFQSRAPLLLKKFEFNAFIGNAAATLNKPIECINVSLFGTGIAFQSPVEILTGMQAQTLEFTSTLQHITERFEPGILINPAESGSVITANLLIRNSAPFVIGDNLIWSAKFYFKELEQNPKSEAFDDEDTTDLSAYYPQQ